MKPRFDPREWSADRLSFAAFTLLGLLFTYGGRGARRSGYDQAVLVRRPGRNALETYSVGALHFAVYLAAAISLLELAGLSDLLILAIFPVPLLLALALLVCALFVAGGVAAIFRSPGERLPLTTRLHAVLGTVTAVLLILFDHWTRWFGVVWLVLLAVNVAASIILLPIRPLLRRISEEAWRDTRFVE
jgi:hypothetical protein